MRRACMGGAGTLVLAIAASARDVDEVTSLAVRVPLDQGDVLEVEFCHGHASFEGLLDLAFVRARCCDQPHAQAAGPVLNDLQIPDLVPQDALLVAEDGAE